MPTTTPAPINATLAVRRRAREPVPAKLTAVSPSASPVAETAGSVSVGASATLLRLAI
jgi:hypothetical protein